MAPPTESEAASSTLPWCQCQASQAPSPHTAKEKSLTWGSLTLYPNALQHRNVLTAPQRDWPSFFLNFFSFSRRDSMRPLLRNVSVENCHVREAAEGGWGRCSAVEGTWVWILRNQVTQQHVSVMPVLVRWEVETGILPKLVDQLT